MKIVFIKDAPKIGRRYEVKEVSDGYGRNFLIKNGLAVLADEKSLGLAESFKKKTLLERETLMADVDKSIMKLKDITVRIFGKANEEGHLFAGIKKDEIEKALLNEAGVKIPSEYLILEKPIKKIGDYEIEISLGGKKAKFKLLVSAL